MKKILLIALLAIGMLPRNGGYSQQHFSLWDFCHWGDCHDFRDWVFNQKSSRSFIVGTFYQQHQPIKSWPLNQLVRYWYLWVRGLGEQYWCIWWRSQNKPCGLYQLTSTVMALWANFGPLGVQLNGLGAKFYLHRKRHPAERKIGDGSNIKSMLLEHFNAYGDGEVLYEESDSPQFKVQGMTPGAYFYTLNQVPLNTWSTEKSNLLKLPHQSTKMLLCFLLLLTV